MFQHYEKPTASQSITHAKSAQSVPCRNIVHTQEILRRLLNCSPLLDWKTSVAPVLSIYMSRMMQCGYPEKYRVDTLGRALRIYNKMLEDDHDGTDQKIGMWWPEEKKKKRRNMNGQPGVDMLPPSSSHQPQTVNLPSP